MKRYICFNSRFCSRATSLTVTFFVLFILLLGTIESQARDENMRKQIILTTKELLATSTGSVPYLVDVLLDQTVLKVEDPTQIRMKKVKIDHDITVELPSYEGSPIISPDGVRAVRSLLSMNRPQLTLEIVKGLNRLDQIKRSDLGSGVVGTMVELLKNANGNGELRSAVVAYLSNHVDKHPWIYERISSFLPRLACASTLGTQNATR